MINDRILELVAPLARSLDQRREAARELAEYLGADDLLILIQEKAHALHLPALGFPQTLHGGRLWRAFVSDVVKHSCAVSELPYPASESRRKSQGWIASDGSILVLFDGRPEAGRVEGVRALLPLISPTFEKERTTQASAAQAKLAQQTAQQSRELAEALDGVRRQLQSTVILREQDIARRRQVEAELEQTNADLRRLNEDLTQFTYAATHDLREPLRTIAIYVQLLQIQLADRLDETAKEYISRVIDGARRIRRLIDGLLEFSGVGEIQPGRATPVQSAAALQEALGDLQITLVEHRAKVSHEDLPLVVADQVHLRQLFQNLIANAVKYRRPDAIPEVRISAHRDGQHWIFGVQDNGIGIAPEHHDRIFIPFQRLHGSEVAGAGIGLATCKRIVERYGGRLWVESQEQNGSVFYFSLPAACERAIDSAGVAAL